MSLLTKQTMLQANSIPSSAERNQAAEFRNRKSPETKTKKKVKGQTRPGFLLHSSSSSCIGDLGDFFTPVLLDLTERDCLFNPFPPHFGSSPQNLHELPSPADPRRFLPKNPAPADGLPPKSAASAPGRHGNGAICSAAGFGRAPAVDLGARGDGKGGGGRCSCGADFVLCDGSQS